MPRDLKEYRVFIAYVSDVEPECKVVIEAILEYNEHTAAPGGVRFDPFCWKRVPAGAGRPQDLINPELQEADLAIFILGEKMGSSSGGSDNKTGLEEEYDLARECLRSEQNMRDIAVYCKVHSSEQLKNADEDLKKVEEFKDQLKANQEFLFNEFTDLDDLRTQINKRVAKWTLLHQKYGEIPVAGGDVARESAVDDKFLSSALRENAGSASTFAKQIVGKFGPDQALAYGRYLRDTGNIEQAIAIFENVEHRAARKDHDEFRAKAFGELGFLYRSIGSIEKSEEMYRNALHFNTHGDDPEGIAISLGNLANLMLGTERYGAAREMYREAISINKRIENDLGLAGDFGGLAMVLSHLDQFQKPKKLYLRSIALHLEFNNKEGAASSTFNLGSLFQRWDRLDEAEEQFNAAMEINRGLGRQYGISLCLGALGGIHCQRGQESGEISYFVKAEERIREALEIQEALRNAEAIATSYGNLAIVLREQRKFDEAADYFARAIRADESLKRSMQVANHFQEWAKLLDQQGDSEGAAEKRRIAVEIGRQRRS